MTKLGCKSVEPWNGGKCPLAPDVQVRVYLRYASSRIGRAGDFVWSHDLYNSYGAEDVVAYEILADPTATTDKR
jgi:hypothetical protein